jgi:hypothetical protein
LAQLKTQNLNDSASYLCKHFILLVQNQVPTLINCRLLKSAALKANTGYKKQPLLLQKPFAVSAKNANYTPLKPTRQYLLS